MDASLPQSVAPNGAAGFDPERKKILLKQVPTVGDLRRRAQRRVPRFAFDFVDSGCGEDVAVRRNRSALDAVLMTPRYGTSVAGISTEVELFGRRYAMPIGVAPMGLGSLIWPGVEEYLAAAAQAAGIPYVLATPGGASIERIAALAPDVFMFQLYAMPRNDLHYSLDLVQRAEAAGAHALIVTMDSPMPSKRPRDLRNAMSLQFRPTARMIAQAMMNPFWSREILRRRVPRTENLVPYAGGKGTSEEMARFAQREIGGGFTWEMVERIRKLWPRPLMVKGILHPDDAERAVAAGVDEIIVSNHGGRNFDAAPATIDALPAIVDRVGDRTVVMMDSGIRIGLDVARAIALGAKFTFAGRPFLFSVGALGAEGAAYVIDLFSAEIRTALGHLGVLSPEALRSVAIHHPGAIGLEHRPLPSLAQAAE